MASDTDAFRAIAEAAVATFTEHAKRAGADAAKVLQATATNVAEIGRDVVNGKLTFDQGMDFIRKAETAATARLAAIANVQARSYVSAVLKSVFGALGGLLGSFKL